MPKVILETLPTYSDPGSAAPFSSDLGSYTGYAISDHHGLRKLGANVETLSPGARSSHRHWHDRNDELVTVLIGELVLIEEDEETPMVAGDIAVFPAGVQNGHCLENRSAASATFLVTGTRLPDDICHYSDIDLLLHPDGSLTRVDGSPPK